MLFNSIPFIYLVIITFGIYYLPFLRKFQSITLIGASFVFYAWNHPYLLLLLIFSIFINTLGSYKVSHAKFSNSQRLFAVVTVVLNLVILATFKYAGLIGKTLFNSNQETLDILLAIPLPIGISFFTFQGISLVIDTFRHDNRLSEESKKSVSFFDHFTHTSLFISLFPQLVAGPIVKAHDFFSQIKPKYFKNIDWDTVISQLIVGYFLKMVIADNLKDFTFELTYPYFQRLSSTHLLLLVFAYSAQIFADFAGYSLIAIGLSAMFGYKIPQNFNFPYIASSFSEFWKRWHISLSSFLKEYLYIPLGGNKKGKVRTYINLMVVMGLGGLWHGAAWSYLIWGLTHGILLAIERFLNDLKWVKIKTYNPIVKVIKTIMVFCIVSLAWLLFKFPDFKHVILFFKAFFNNVDVFNDRLTYLYILTYAFPLVLYHIHYAIKDKFTVSINKIKPVALGLLLLLLLLNSGSPQDFIYFQF